MPERVIRLSKAQADDIAVVCSLGSETLTRIVAAIQALPITIKREKIEAAIASQFDSEKVKPLTRILFGLSRVHRRNFDDDSVAGLLESISIPAEWDEVRRAKWVECQPALQRLLSLESVILATKAMDLSFDVERFCVGARIITDIRPVFDLPRNQVVGSTIRQTLRLEYMSVDGTVASMSIGLDADDINRLKKTCDEAIHKTDVAKETLEKSGLTDIIVPGEDG
jgi:hypothetical protein